MVTILYFAAAREAAGVQGESLEIAPESTVAELREALVRNHPRLEKIISRCRIAVNEDLVTDETPIPAGAEVAVIPPVSGGAPACRVVKSPLDLREVIDAVRAPERGAVVTFQGDVRGETKGRKVLRIEYEAYVPMAERSLARIADEVGREHGCAVSVVHRYGRLLPGETAVVIACGSPHRTPAFRACEQVIERIKSEVPIWKCEVFEDGTTWVGLGP